MSCREISADWAAQRIKGLSLWSAIVNALRPKRPGKKSEVIKTLIDSFRYPRLGPGMMWSPARRALASSAERSKWDPGSRAAATRSPSTGGP